MQILIKDNKTFVQILSDIWYCSHFCVYSSASPALLCTMQIWLTRSFRRLDTTRTLHHLKSVMRSVCDQAFSFSLFIFLLAFHFRIMDLKLSSNIGITIFKILFGSSGNELKKILYGWNNLKGCCKMFLLKDITFDLWIILHD